MALLHILKFVTQNVSFLLMDIIFTKTIFDIMFMLNFTYFMLNTFLKKKYFELQVGFNLLIHFLHYAVYKVNDETYSLDKLANSHYCRVA